MARRPDLEAVLTTNGWMVSIPANLTPTGKRQRKFFGESKSKAEKFAREIRTRYHKGERQTLLKPDDPDPPPPVAVEIDFFAHEYGWSIETILALPPDQKEELEFQCEEKDGTVKTLKTFKWGLWASQTAQKGGNPVFNGGSK